MYLDVYISIAITIVAIVSLGLSVIGLPGSWILVGTGAVMAFYLNADRTSAMHLWTFLAITAVAAFGELLEFIAGAAGVSKLGGSRRSAALAIVGSIVGAIMGLFIGTPVPVVGSIVVSLLLGGVGAFAGAVLGERWKGRSWDEAFAIGKAAFWGRLLGTMGKLVCSGTNMCVVIAAAWMR